MEAIAQPIGQKPMRVPGMSQRSIAKKKKKKDTKNTTMNTGILPTTMNQNSPLSGTLSMMKTPQLPWSRWPSATMMKHQLKGWMSLQKLPNSFMWVTWPLAPIRGRPRVSKVETKEKAKESTSSGHSSVYRTEPSTWQS